MRILLIDQYGEMGGAQQVLLEAAGAFAARGWRLHAAAPSGPLLDRLRPYTQGATPIECGPFHSRWKTAADAVRLGWQLPGQAGAIRAAARALDADLLYVNGPRLLPAAAWARGGRPVLFHAHSVTLQPAAAQLAGWALRAAWTQVVASSRFVADALRVARGRIQVIYNGVAAAGAGPVRRQRFTRIGVLGRIAPEKGQLLFVRAAALAARRHPELTFLVGGGPVIADSDYFAAVRRAAGPEVRFAGWIDDPASFFSQIDLLVVPSQPCDANPRVIPEAFSAGVPVLAFAAGGIPELIEDGVTGLLLRDRTPEALAEAMAAPGPPERLHEIACRAWASWRERFTLDRFQEEICRAAVAIARASATA
jgi:glycosyltransferase involved in cell wall biosynthesis